MIRRLRSLLLAVLPAIALGEERFPPPDFTSGYVMPAPTAPPPQHDWLVGLDAALLVIALAVAAWLVHGRRSRVGMTILGLFSLAWFGFVREGCVCPIGAIQNVAEAAATSAPLPWIIALFFTLPLAAALVVGRVFCGGVCPLGAIQDLVLIRPVAVPASIAGALGLLPYAYLGAGVLMAALGGTWIICAYDPFVGFFRQGGPAGVMIFGGLLLVIGTVVGRPYCRFLCPYGVLLRWLSPLARWTVHVSPKPCVKCRLCEQSCPYGAISAPTPAEVPRRNRILPFALLPVLAVLGGVLGWHAGPAAARWNPQVALAEVLARDAAGTPPAAGSAEARNLEAFVKRGGDGEALATTTATLRHRFRIGAALVGILVGLVAGLRLVRAAFLKSSDIYQADAGPCVSCARCFDDCPRGKAPKPKPAPNPVCTTDAGGPAATGAPSC